MDIIESKFASSDVESGIELLNGRAVGGGVGEMDLSFAARIGNGARSLNRKISFSEDGIVVSSERLQVSDIDVEEVRAQSESAVASEMAVLERCGSIEFGGSVVMAQGRVVQRDAIEGKLNRGGKRIPLRFEFRSVGCGGQSDVEIINLQTASKLG